MFASARKAFGLIFDPAFRGIAARSVLYTLLLFAAGLTAAEMLIAQLPVLESPVVNRALELLAPVLWVFLILGLGAPVAAFSGTLFLDGLAERIEARDYPRDTPALPGRFGAALKAGLRLAAMVLGADILLLPIDIGLPGLGELASLIVNGWLLGWEYFELAALRHLSAADAERMRKTHAGQVWLGGTLISVMSVVPVLNLVAPLFGTALMVHLFQQMQRTAS
jgi:CysZ protein